jgi:hypothetical protein
MRNEGKKNERRSTPPSFGILLLPRQIGSEHVLHHKLPSKQTKRKKDGFQFVRNKKILVIIAFTKQKKKQHSKDFLSFSFSLSLLGKNTLSKKAHFVQCTTAFSNRLRCIINVSIITFHQKGERERDPRSLSRAHRARAAQARLGEIQNKKTSLFSCCSYSYLKLTHSIIR